MRRGWVLIPLLLLLADTAAADPGANDEPSTPTAAALSEGLSLLHGHRVRGETKEATALALRLFESHPDDLTLHMAYQDLRLGQGDRAGLIREYAGRAGEREDSADAQYLHGRLLDGRKAIPILRKALRLEPGHFWALCGLGTEYLEEGRTSDARKYLERAWKADPDSAVPVNLLGWVEEREGQVRKAEMLYRESSVLDETYLLPRVNLGILLIGQARLEEAVDVLKAAQKLAPEDPLPLLGLGMVRAAEGRMAGALVFYDRAMKLESHTPDSLNLLGSAYLGLEQYKLARECFSEALRRNPEHVSTLINLGYADLAEGEVDRASQWVTRAIALDPESPEAHYFHGLCLEWSGKATSAEKAYLRAAELDGDQPDYQRALGALYAGLGRGKEAVRAYAKAADIAGRSVASLLDLGFALVSAGENCQAAACFEEVVREDPANLTAWMNLGLLYQEKLGNKARALKAYQAYLDQGGTDPRVTEWLDQLR